MAFYWTAKGNFYAKLWASHAQTVNGTTDSRGSVTTVCLSAGLILQTRTMCARNGRREMTAGEKIRKRRLELGITQKDVSRMIGTTGAYVSAVEKQKRGVKKETRLAKFAEALQCSVNDLKSDVPKGMVDPTNDEFGAVCNCAVRYCLGRRSYMPSLVCRYIISLLPELTEKTLDCFERDIAERKRTGFDFGDSCDYETWDAFYKAVCGEIEGRKDNG